MKTTVTIGIPAYQSESNIGQLLASLLKQNETGFKLEKIIVYADGCTDKTVSVARSVKSKKIQIIVSRRNRGFAYALQSLINHNKSSIFVLLNDDIKINSNIVIKELVQPLIKNSEVGLVGGNIKALRPESFIGRCIYTSYLVFEPLRYKLKRGESDLTCDGKILAFSKEFTKKLKLTNITAGNVDIHLYYENLNQGRIYKFAKKAVTYYRLPETIADFKNQESRAEISRKLAKKRFSKTFITEHKIPLISYLKSSLRIFLKYPIETIIFKTFINTRLNLRKKTYSKWQLALSTKKLSLLAMDWEAFFKQL